MSSPAAQNDQIAELLTPLGKDKLVLSTLSVAEGISHPFDIHLEALSQDDNIDFNALLGRNCGIRLDTAGGTVRHFNGVLVEAGWFGEREQLSAYALTLRPWFWLLTHTSDCRIFQNKTVIEIISDVFDRAGFSDYECRVTGSYKRIEYCVQYRESHYNFLCRLMEAYGIFYFFEHSADKHQLILADSKSSLRPVPDLATLPFAGMGARTRDDREYLTTWHSSRVFRTGKVSVNAYDFTKPTANLHTDSIAQNGYAHGQMEVYDYPHKYKHGEEQDAGKTFADAKLQARQSEDRRRIASGRAPSLFPGALTSLVEHPTGTENSEYLVVSASHHYVAQSYRSGTDSEGNSYSGHYVLQPGDRPYKAAPVTPVPTIAGPQTALVVGKAGEEIHTDEHGRIKIQFHWDRQGKRDEKSSRWVRVAQIGSGRKWGGVVIPRIGMEVVVEFIEGDPDRPLVVGTVYNGDNTLPYDMPANKTRSGVKTRSSKGGSEQHYNELVFEDKKNGEFVRLHAEKDLDSTIEDGEKRLIKGKNKKDEGETARETVIEKGDDVLSIRGDQNMTIKRDQTVDIARDQSVKVGRNITIEAGDRITLKVGASTITMTAGAIAIKTPKLTSDTTLTETTATAMLTQKSALIKLN